MTSKKWTCKVVKTQRGGNGEWFRHATAATFDRIEDAAAYASEFAENQAGVAGTKILVLSRSGEQVLATFAAAN